MPSAISNPVESVSDQSMTALVPKPSRWRSSIVAGIAIGALVVAWMAPTLFKPSVGQDNSGGVWMALPAQSQVITIAQLRSEGFGGVDLRSVADVNGATVEEAWVVGDAFTEFNEALDRDDFASTLDYLQAALPGDNVGSATALPQHLDNHEAADLIVVWNINACDQLIDEDRPTIALRSFLRTTTHEPLQPIAGPSFDISTLRENGICTDG